MSTEDPSHGFIDGLAVLIAVAIVVLITAVNDYQKEKQFRKLNDKKNDRLINVVRDGKEMRITIFDLVVGDIMLLNAGDIIPGDGVYIDGKQLQCDESSATGESNTIRKGHAAEGRDPFFLSGTQVVEGFGSALVVAVGELSFNGRLMLALRQPAEDTPLQVKLAKLANIIGNFGIIAATIIFLAQVIKYFAVEGSGVESGDALRQVADFLVIAITIVVVAVPEGLPLAVTISLAYSMGWMMRDNNLVRRLESCEVSGGVTTICSDKTGTLTQNKMSVVGGQIMGIEFDEKNAFAKDKLTEASQKLLCEGIAINSTAFEETNEEGKVEFIGSKTECALLMFARNMGASYSDIRKNVTIEELYPFSSKRKRMSTLVSGGQDSSNGQCLLHTKGASEVILRMCTQYRNADGSVRDIDDTLRSELETKIQTMAEGALRTLTLAYRQTSEKKDLTDDDEPQLILLAIVGILDPLRPEVADAVERCHSAGVVVRMVTGDNVITATNIAKNCHIIKSEEDECMEGPVFRKLSERERMKVLPKLRVLARSSPTDKLILVSTLQKMGEVVAVTGDGVNDGPALKKADVGFSMGIAGTEVAKEASAIVLLDDNFASIINAIKWGRNVFDNIRKFLQFQLCVNFTAILVVFIVIMADPEGRAESAPLKPVQLLWINLIMDTFAAVALATEPAYEALLKFKPFDRNEPLVTTYMGRRMIFQIILQTTTFLLLTYLGEDLFDTEKTLEEIIDEDDDVGQFGRKHYTVIFNCFVLTQLFNQFNSRKIRHEFNVFSRLLRHRIFIGVWLFAFVVQILIVTFGGDFVQVEALSIEQWLGCIAVACLTFVWTFIFNLLPESITTDSWAWYDSLRDRFFCKCCKPGGGYELPEEEEEEGEEDVFVDDATAPATAETKFGGPGERRLSRMRAIPDPTPRDRWASVIGAVMTQIDVVRIFRRVHR
jgi:Ca2+-transporting ATPase